MRRMLTVLAFVLLLAGVTKGNEFRKKNYSRPRTEIVYLHDTVYLDSARLQARALSVDEILEGVQPLKGPGCDYLTALLKSPRVFRGYQNVSVPAFHIDRSMVWRTVSIEEACGDSVAAVDSLLLSPQLPQVDGALPEIMIPASVSDPLVIEEESAADSIRYIPNPFEPQRVPRWLSQGKRLRQMSDALVYVGMVDHPATIDYAFWHLPVPPKMPEQDTSFEAYIRNQWLPKPAQRIEGGLMEVDKIHWIHDVNGSLHFSQAYLSPNWYQGGNNSLSLLINLYWHVQLNQMFHPNLLFDNVVSYKLGLTSTPQDKYHKYAISEDLFQWNMKGGVKAFERWFYSVTVQFKTQILNNYGSDSMVRTAAFLSPGDFNAGLGMTYNYVNKKKTLKFNASISPISYNMKTCIDPLVDPTQFNIPAGRKISNEYGSNAELTLDWNICKSINYKSRLFLFSNYKYFQGDWENTLSFNINRFLSTQIYCHLRYDTSSDLSIGKWHHWMLKEILSFGFSYTFSTKG